MILIGDSDFGIMFRVMEEFEKKTKPSTGLNFEYVSFQSPYADKKYEGLQNRLKEMPKGNINVSFDL